MPPEITLVKYINMVAIHSSKQTEGINLVGRELTNLPFSDYTEVMKA